MRYISFAFSFIAVLIFSAAASAQTFSNTAAITIPSAGNASPYPSTVSVSGITGTVSKVTVTLNGVGHTYPDDVGVLLVGPTGVKVRLMTDVGGGNTGSGGDPISGVNLTFDDAATASLPDSSTITSGTYKPTQGTGANGFGTTHPADFASPAPASPYALTLSSFNSASPNGTWSLYVDDDSAGDSGTIAGGWSITFTAGGGSGSTKKLFDFTGSGRTSFVTLGFPTLGLIRWNIAGNPASATPNQAVIRSVDFGQVGDNDTFGDAVVPNDFVGDNKTDLAVYRDTNSTFYVAETPLGTGGVTLARAFPFGNGATDSAGGDGDYDGDGKADFTLIRLISGQLNWYILRSSTNTISYVQFGDTVGASGATFFPGADFNGDGRADLIYVKRFTSAPRQLVYYIGDAVNRTLIAAYTFGDFSTDFSVAPADYTGDGRADLVAVRQDTTLNAQIWYIYNTATGAVTATRFGIPSLDFDNPPIDYVVRGDYDGDGRSDIAVWRTAARTFYWINSSNGSLQSQIFGNTGDTPLGAFGTY